MKIKLNELFSKRLIVYLAFSPPVIFVLYDIIFYYIPIHINNYINITSEIYFFMIFCDIFAIASFLLLFSFIKRNKKRTIEYYYGGTKRSLSIFYYYIFFIIIFFLIHYLILHVFERIDYGEIFINYAKFYAMSKRGTAWVFGIINMLIFVMIIDMYFSGYNRHKFFMFILSLILVAMTGGRSLLIVFLMFSMFIFIVIHRKRISFKTIILLILLSSIIFVGNAILRATDYETYVNSKSSSLDFDNAFVLNDVLEFQQNRPHDGYLIFLEDIYYMFIPRKLMPDKPMSTAETRLVYPSIASYGTNYTFGMYANSFLNIGYLSIIIIPLFILMINFMYIKYVYLSKNKSFNLFVIAFFIFFYIQFVRGGIFNYRLLMIYISLLLGFLAYKLLTLKLRFKQ
ncbi:oligosaccharide repeat unit polymerase [Sulfurimonas sediminis]|uniref:Oligosaccharide repeat unit polymerase n=1 Tax=Sulfurimonas sediminis TaxID=2590020 RepID=A0A7M1B0J4_9BACT|nr:O-antigen polymerase [Sulfurimonas sediminis]QOP43234.1 oligosaccharide repeat unit polymerase [Sulfurimonas sediminis]